MEGDDSWISDCFVAPEVKKDQPVFLLGEGLPQPSGAQFAALVYAAQAGFRYANPVIVAPVAVQFEVPVGAGATEP